MIIGLEDLKMMFCLEVEKGKINEEPKEEVEEEPKEVEEEPKEVEEEPKEEVEDKIKKIYYLHLLSFTVLRRNADYKKN